MASHRPHISETLRAISISWASCFVYMQSLPPPPPLNLRGKFSFNEPIIKFLKGSFNHRSSFRIVNEIYLKKSLPLILFIRPFDIDHQSFPDWLNVGPTSIKSFNKLKRFCQKKKKKKSIDRLFNSDEFVSLRSTRVCSKLIKKNFFFLERISRTVYKKKKKKRRVRNIIE